jgi:hypothetical protein
MIAAESSGVPRYDYGASEDLTSGAIGFVIHCSFNREKSAVREGLAALSPYIGALPSRGGLPRIKDTENFREAASDIGEAATAITQAVPGVDEVQPGVAVPAGREVAVDVRCAAAAAAGISLIKLACSGVVMVKLDPKHAWACSPTSALAQLLADIAGGRRAPLQ